MGGASPKTNLADKLPGEIAVRLILVTNDRRLANIGNLQSDDAIAIEANKLDLVRRLAVNPFLKRRLPIHFANFLVGLAHGLEHHLAIHAHQHFVVQDRTLEFGRQAYRRRPRPES